MNDPSPSQPAAPAITILLVVLSLALSLAWFWQMMFVIPEYERVFAEFRMVVPSHTEATISASRFFVAYWHILALVALLAYAVIGYVSYHLRHRSSRHGLCRLWFVLIIGCPLAIQTITLLSVITTQGILLDNLRGIK